MRERILALFNHHELDRVPFVQYEGINPNDEAWELLGRENLGVLRWVSTFRVSHPNCRLTSTESMESGIRTVHRRLETPAGILTERSQRQPTYDAGSIKEHFIKRVEDYEPFLAYLNDITVEPDPSEIESCYRELGDSGLPHTSVRRSPFQQMWIEWINIMDLCAHLAETPEIVEQVFSRLGELMIEMTKITLDFDPPYIVIPDNITAPMIGTAYFNKYCAPLYDRISGMAAEKNISVVVHMDGDLKPLWPEITKSKIGGIDSLSPPPDNDTSAGAALSMWPDKIVMLNFPSSIHLLEPDEIYRVAIDILEEAGHTGRLQIQISENVPPNVWKASYPAIAKAIEDFGRP